MRPSMKTVMISAIMLSVGLAACKKEEPSNVPESNVEQEVQEAKEEVDEAEAAVGEEMEEDVQDAAEQLDEATDEAEEDEPEGAS